MRYFLSSSDVYLFVAGDAVPGPVACGGIEYVASEEFFGISGTQVDNSLMNVGSVGTKFCDVDFVGDFAAGHKPVFGTFAVFRADSLKIAVILLNESEVELFEDVGEESAAVEGSRPLVNADQDGRQECFVVKGCGSRYASSRGGVTDCGEVGAGAWELEIFDDMAEILVFLSGKDGVEESSVMVFFWFMDDGVLEE